jgi:hypothetical protein
MAQTMLLQDREAPITKPRRQPRRLPARCRYDHMTASSLAALRFGAASYGHSLATNVAAFVPEIISKRGSKSAILPLSILVKPMREARDCCPEILTTASGKRF